MIRARYFGWLSSGIGIATLASTLGLGCAAASAEEESIEGADDALTLGAGAKFVVRAEAKTVTLATTVGDCSNCNLLEALERVSKGRITSFDDLRGKAILIHPIEGKAADGAFLRAEKVTKEEGRIVLEGEPIRLEELGRLEEDDVVRIYLDVKLPVGGGKSSKTKESEASLGSEGAQIVPASLAFGSVRPQQFGGLLAGDAPTIIVWKGITPQVDFLGFIKPSMTDLSFRPEVKLAWTEGRGVEVGLQLDLEGEAGIDITGILGANGQLVKWSVETPDVMMLAPVGLALPFRLTFSASFQCNAVSGGKVDISARQRFQIHAGGSALINPTPDAPVESWVREGSWPFGVSGRTSVDLRKFEVAPSVGLLCMVRLNANFSPKWFPMGGLYITISPQMLFLVAEQPKPQLAVHLAAGAWTTSNAAVELNLLTWKP